MYQSTGIYGSFINIVNNSETSNSKIVLGKGYTINIMDMYSTEELMEKKWRLLKILKDIIGLYGVQEAFMNDAINIAYRESGFRDDDPNTWNNKKSPTLRDVYDALEFLLYMDDRHPGDKISITTCMNRLRVYAVGGERLGIFSKQYDSNKMSIEVVINSGMTIDFSEIKYESALKMITLALLYEVMMYVRERKREDYTIIRMSHDIYNIIEGSDILSTIHNMNRDYRVVIDVIETDKIQMNTQPSFDTKDIYEADVEDIVEKEFIIDKFGCTNCGGTISPTHYDELRTSGRTRCEYCNILIVARRIR